MPGGTIRSSGGLRISSFDERILTAARSRVSLVLPTVKYNGVGPGERERHGLGGNQGTEDRADLLLDGGERGSGVGIAGVRRQRGGEACVPVAADVGFDQHRPGLVDAGPHSADRPQPGGEVGTGEIGERGDRDVGGARGALGDVGDDGGRSDVDASVLCGIGGDRGEQLSGRQRAVDGREHQRDGAVLSGVQLDAGEQPGRGDRRAGVTGVVGAGVVRRDVVGVVRRDVGAGAGARFGADASVSLVLVSALVLARRRWRPSARRRAGGGQHCEASCFDRAHPFAIAEVDERCRRRRRVRDRGEQQHAYADQP